MADEWTEEQRREFIIKDNASLGDWDLGGFTGPLKLGFRI